MDYMVEMNKNYEIQTALENKEILIELASGAYHFDLVLSIADLQSSDDQSFNDWVSCLQEAYEPFNNGLTVAMQEQLITGISDDDYLKMLGIIK